MSIVVNDLHRLIGQLTPHISTADTLPTINGIHLEVTSGRLVAAATDRYTFAVTHREVEETEEPSQWRALLDRADLHALRTLFPARTAGQGLRLAYDPPTVEDPDGGLVFRLHDRVLRLSANSEHAAKFPRW